MAKRPLTSDPAGTPKATRARKPQAAATVPPGIDVAADNPATIASEAPAPDRILSGTPEFSTLPGAIAPDGGGPSDEEIREAAYHRFLARGTAQGSELDDWLEAERLLRKK